jgi:hypothetical protein
MPTIVKRPYITRLLEQIAANPTLTDAELAAALSAPSKAGEQIEPISADAARGQVGWLETAQVEAQALADAPKSATAQLAASAWLGRSGNFDFATGSDDRDLLGTLVSEGLLSAATSAAIITTATVDVPGPSIAEGWGLGQCLPCFVEQAREYVGMEPTEIGEQLAALLLVPWLTPRVSLTIAEVLALPDYAAFRDGVVMRCSELETAAAVDAVAAEVLTMLKGSGS